MAHRKPYMVDLLLLGVVVIWGTNFAVMKLAYRSFHPIAFNAIRFLISSTAIAIIINVSGPKVRIDRKDLKSILWLGFLLHPLYQFVFVLGLERTKAGNAGLISALVPIFAFLIGVFTKRESFSRGVVTGILLSFIGVGAIVSFSSAGLSVNGTWRGDLLLIGAAFVWGWYSASSTSLLVKYGSFKIMGWTMLAGTTLLVPLSLPWLWTQDWGGIQQSAWIALVFSALLSIVYSYCVWAYALVHIGVTHTSMFSNLTPIIALFAGWFLLGEQPSPVQIIGVVLVLTGVFLVRSRNPQRGV